MNQELEPAKRIFDKVYSNDLYKMFEWMSKSDLKRELKDISEHLYLYLDKEISEKEQINKVCVSSDFTETLAWIVALLVLIFVFSATLMLWILFIIDFVYY